MIEGECFAKENTTFFLKTDNVSAAKINEFLRKHGINDVIASYQPKFEAVELFYDGKGDNYHLSGQVLDVPRVILVNQGAKTAWLVKEKHFCECYQVLDEK
jgi:hypothetical protein